jgi:hypothetical protein
MRLPVSVKHIQIDKAGSAIVISVSVATAVIIFSLVSVKTLLSQASYQRKVVNEKHIAINQLRSNIAAVNTLVTQFKSFDSENPNMIGGAGSNNGTGAKDGDNARITLDALPSKYDFPALVSSIEKVIKAGGLTNSTIGGTDQSAQNSNDPAVNPIPVPIALTIGGSGSYSTVQNLIQNFEQSIRPFDPTTIQISGGTSSLQLTLNMNTYYQQAKSLDYQMKGTK